MEWPWLALSAGGSGDNMDVMTIEAALQIMVVGALWGMGLELTLSLAGAAIYKVLRTFTQ